MTLKHGAQNRQFARYTTKTVIQTVIQTQTPNIECLLFLAAVRNILLPDNNANETHCYISMASLHYFLLLTVTSTLTTTTMEHIVGFR